MPPKKSSKEPRKGQSKNLQNEKLSDLQGFLKYNSFVFLKIYKELTGLVAEFKREEKVVSGPVRIGESDVVGYRLEELHAACNQVLKIENEFVETSTRREVKLFHVIDRMCIEAERVHKAIKVIMLHLLALQRIWNKFSQQIPRYETVEVLYDLAIDSLFLMEGEEYNRKNAISEAFEDFDNQVSRHIEAIEKLLNSLTLGEGVLCQYLADSATKDIEVKAGAIKADGNCMYRAVIVALEEVVGRDHLGTIPLGINENERIAYLRRMVAGRLRALYKEGVNEATATIFNNAIATARMHHEFIGDDTTEEDAINFYIDTIIGIPGQANWGDHTVLQMIADVLHIAIFVHREENGEVIHILPQGEVDGELPGIHLLHQGEVHYEVHHENGYDDMPPLEGEGLEQEIAAAITNYVPVMPSLNLTNVSLLEEGEPSFVIGGFPVHSSTL